mmetsp:Transcript_18075/g.54512  ORF Transcript_18075/g.54512 Transcript_18075/m.54512 type:complete len:219 (+) Transcript_18075:2933-3589(+)
MTLRRTGVSSPPGAASPRCRATGSRTARWASSVVGQTASTPSAASVAAKASSGTSLAQAPPPLPGSLPPAVSPPRAPVRARDMQRGGRSQVRSLCWSRTSRETCPSRSCAGGTPAGSLATRRWRRNKSSRAPRGLRASAWALPWLVGPGAGRTERIGVDCVAVADASRCHRRGQAQAGDGQMPAPGCLFRWVTARSIPFSTPGPLRPPRGRGRSGGSV